MVQRSVKDPEVLRHSVLDFRQMSAFVRDPLIIERGQGVYLWDVDGRRYFDGIAGIFVVAVGHGNQRVIQAMKEQMDQLCYAPILHGTNPRAIELNALIAEVAPEPLSTVKLASSGSEATEMAMKLCRQYWKQSGHPTKYKIISRYYGYHGATLGAMAASGTPKRREPFEPLPAGFVHVPTVHCYRCPYGRERGNCGTFCAEYVRQVIALEGPETVAAVIVEPIGNTGGILVPPPDYLPRLREICDEFQVLLIFDEMITGMGRTGRLFCFEHFDVVPDVLCLGKGLSSGYAPLAATVWTDRVQEAFWGPEEAGVEFGHGQTFSGHPICAAAGLANIRELLDRDLPARAAQMGEQLEGRLREIASQTGVIGDVRGMGLLWGIEFARDPATKRPFPSALQIGHRIGEEAQRRGLIVRHDPDWIALAPPLIVSEDELDEMCDILQKSIEAVLSQLEL